MLESILALAILGVALGLIGQLVRIGTRSAAAARDLTTAQLLAESAVSEISAGIVPLEPVPLSATDETQQWMYSIEVSPLDVDGLHSVRVTVMRNLPPNKHPAKYELLRWLADPAVDFAELDGTAAGTGGASIGGTDDT